MSPAYMSAELQVTCLPEPALRECWVYRPLLVLTLLLTMSRCLPEPCPRVAGACPRGKVGQGTAQGCPRRAESCPAFCRFWCLPEKETMVGLRKTILAIFIISIMIEDLLCARALRALAYLIPTTTSQGEFHCPFFLDVNTLVVSRASVSDF